MIPNKQIGWSEKANLLWEISRQLDRLNSQMCTGGCPTTTTTTTVNLCNSYTITNQDDFDTTYSYIDCGGRLVEDVSISAFGTAEFCAQFDSVNFNGEIVDNGLCI
jgi:hypothetical protein